MHCPDPPQGIQFLRYTEASRILSLLGRDFDAHDVTATGIVINASKLMFVYADRAGTLHQVSEARRHHSLQPPTAANHLPRPST